MTSDPHDAEREVRSIVLRAESLLAIERPREAIPPFQDALRIDPENLHALAGMARAYLALGDTATALKFAEDAIRAEPEHEWGHRLRSIVLQHRGNKVGALESARRAVEVAPDDILPLTQLFSALRGLKKKTEMRQVANRMVEIAPNNTASHISLGLVHLDARRHDDAEAAFRRALAIDPEDWAAMNNIGAVLQRKGRHAESMEFYYRAAQINPELPLPRKNFFLAAKKHLAEGTTIGITFLVWGLFILRDSDYGREMSSLIVLAIVGGIFGLRMLARRVRFKQLRDPLQRVLTDEQRRLRRNYVRRFLKFCLVAALIVGLYLALLWWFT